MYMKTERLNLRIDKETYDMISILKDKFSINISSLIRNHIRDTYETKTKNRNRKNIQQT